MSSKRRTLRSIWGTVRDNSHQQPSFPSPPASPRPGRIPEMPTSVEERIMSSDDLQSSVEALETVLKTMDQVRDQTNRYNTVLREHARSMRGYAANMQLIATRDDKGAQKPTLSEERVSERLLVHCANYYDRLAEAQEQLVLFLIFLE